MLTQQSVAAQPRSPGLAPGTRHHYRLTGGNSGSVPVVVKEFDGLKLLVVDVLHTTHVPIRDVCRRKLRTLHGSNKGEIVVVQANRLGPLRLALHRYVDGHLHSEGSLLETAGLGRIINIIG